jgi:hypothetical protein
VNPSVDQPAAEREPDNVTPCWACEGSGTTGSLDTDVFECTICDGTGLSAQHRTPAEMTDDEANEEYDGLPVSMMADTDIRVALAVGLAGQLVEPALDWSAFEACPSCWAQTGAPCVILGGYNPSTPHPDRQRKPVEPERRTVSLEVLTPALLAEEEGRRRTEAAETGVSFEPIPAAAAVAVVARVDGLLCGVFDDDTGWRCKGPDLLAALLRSGRDLADDGDAELLMPTPDVLAALDGKPNDALWTSEITMRADQLEPGWAITNYAAEGAAAVVTAVDDQCQDETCPWHGTCIAVTAGGLEPLHVSTWSTFEVRIPVSVTR